MIGLNMRSNFRAKHSPLLAVMLLVIALHATGVLWWTQAQAVSGRGVWAASHSQPFRVRATVMQETMVMPVGDASVTAPSPLVVRDAESQKPSAQAASDDGGTLAQVGSERLWAPIPSDYFSDEQVDVISRPKDEWMLDWPQVPLTHEAWRVTVRMWVSAAGFVDHVETLDAQPSAEWVSKFLAPLARTEMEPATLAGQPVPVTYVVQLAPDQLQ